MDTHKATFSGVHGASKGNRSPLVPRQGLRLCQRPLPVLAGVGAGYSRVGTQDSIMIRVPDLTVLVHLIDMTGPLAITSANPSGEVDSTHHDMVIS